MDEKELEFSLEDIIREFSDAPQEPEAEEPEQQETAEEPAAQEPDQEAAPAEEPVEEPAEESAPVQVGGDTIRFDKIPEVKGVVRNAQPIDDEDEPICPPVQEEKTEPFSEEWEPEYEQPIAEYVPPQPIMFHPKSRLRELKKKLVTGPEKQYYALSEKGLGKLQAAIFFSVIVVLVSAVTTAMFAFHAISPERLKLMVFGQFLAMLISALLGYNQLLDGAAALLKKKFSLNTLLVFTFLLCCVDGVMGLYQQRIPCCAAFSLQVTMSLWSEYQKRNTKLGQLDTMRKATRLDSIHVVEDYYQETKGFVRGEGQVEHFMDTYQDSPQLEKTLSLYALVALCVSVAVGVVAGVLHGVFAGIQVAAVTCLAAMPASMFVTLSRPRAVLERRFHALGTVLCGWQGMEGLADKAVFPLNHMDMFPAGSVKMNGVKFFGSRQPDEIIAYATALMENDGGNLAPLFSYLLDSRNGKHYEVENFQNYDGGIGGEVAGEPVLAGTLAFLKEMGVELPEGIRVNKAVCVAVDGELCGLFAITYEKDRAAAAGMTTLSAYRGLQTVLTDGEFMLNADFIHDCFDVKTKRMLFPDRSERAQLAEKTPEPDAPAMALVTGEGLAPFAYAVTGARTLKTAAKAGVITAMIGGGVGMAMMLVLAIIGATQLLTPIHMFLYELVWLVPGLLITEWTRSI